MTEYLVSTTWAVPFGLLVAVQAYRRGHGFVPWVVLVVLAANPIYPLILAALLPHRGRQRLRERFTAELDAELAAAGVGPTLAAVRPPPIDRSIGDAPTADPGRSVGDRMTVDPDRSLGDQPTRD